MMPSMNRRTFLARTAASAVGTTLWLPALAPFFFGPLRESAHCTETYAYCLPVVPGVVLAALTGLEDAPFLVLAGAITLVALALLVALLRRLRGAAAAIVQLVAGVTVLFEAIGFANALRA